MQRRLRTGFHCIQSRLNLLTRFGSIFESKRLESLTMASETVEAAILPGRACGHCSLCCKLLRIEAFDKPEGRWCSHCSPGNIGRKIYDERPDECRDSYCAWLTAIDVGQEWYPIKCKMVLYAEAEGNRIALHVDPSWPSAWREEPYYSQLKKWAIHAAESSQQLVVYIRNRVIVLLPNKEIDLGIIERGDQIMVASSWTANGKEWHAFTVPAKDVPAERIGKWTRWQNPAWYK
jgi:hypothetical protein